MFHRPYIDSRGSLQFKGFGWFAVAVVPWVYGVIEIVKAVV